MAPRFEREIIVQESKLPVGLLHKPEQKESALSGFDPSPEHMENWIKSLPRADIGEAARKVYQGLHELNRVKIPDSDRSRIADMFSEPLNFLSMSLKKHYIGLPFPLARKKHRVALLARELYAEMAIAYKIIIENKNVVGASRLDHKFIGVTLHRAIHYLSQVLLRCYQIYIPAPPNIWREIHGLYRYAYENKLHDTSVKSPLDGAGTTITSLYKRIVLLSLANPYRLRQNEIETLYAMLEKWESLVLIKEIVDPEQQTGMCSFNLNSDEPPGYLILCSDSSVSSCRVLDTASLVESLRNDIALGVTAKSLGALAKNNHLNTEQLQHLALAWGGMAKRNFSRTAKDSKVLVTLGLPATHYFICDALQQISAQTTPPSVAKPLEPLPSNLNLVPRETSPDQQGAVGKHLLSKARLISNPVYNILNPDIRKKDVWNRYIKPPAPHYDPAAAAPLAKTVPWNNDASQTVKEFEFHICATINESVGGFCLVWMPLDGSDLRSLNALNGELIGMQEIDEENKSRWSISVVRWMKSRDGKQLELGIEKLAPYAVSATVRQEKVRKPTDFQLALILPENKATEQPITLIAPNSYEVDDMLILDIDGEKKTIQLSKVLDSTSAFSHFQYNEIKKPERTREASSDDETAWNFDNLWSSL